MKLTNAQVIISGSTIEAYSYKERPLSYAFTSSRRSKTRSRIVVVDEKSLEKKKESRKHSMLRARSRLRRLVNSNAWFWNKPDKRPFLPIFVTLTFREDIRDPKVANRIFSKFVKRLNYATDKGKKTTLKYVVVTEFQDFSRGGVIHYHVIFFNLAFIWKDDLFAIWDNGIVDIKKIQHVKNVGAYITKYMSKHFEDNRLDGKKRYFSSRGLLKPIEIRDQRKANAVIAAIPRKFVVHEREYTTEQQGVTSYTQYRLKKRKSLVDAIPALRDLLC
jgi:hypothetical protein